MLTEIQDRIQTIDYLIRTKSTGSPRRLAQHLDISERRLYDLLNEMRILGAPIEYHRLNRTYYYKEKGKFNFGFVKEC